MSSFDSLLLIETPAGLLQVCDKDLPQITNRVFVLILDRGIRMSA